MGISAASTNSLTIAELTGQMRSIELRGAGMPHIGAEWGSKLSVKTHWYPGNGDEATQHVLGPQDPPSKWEGSWRRTMLSRTPAVVTAGGTFNVVDPHVLVDAVEALQRSGARLRVTWSAATFDGTVVSKIRDGRLVSFTHKWDKVTDVHWDAEFEWVGRGTSTQKVIATRDGTASDVQDALTAELTNFTNVLAVEHDWSASNRTIPKSASAFSLGALEAFAEAPLALVNSVSRQIQQQVSTLQQIGQIASTIANEPYAIADAVVNTARDATSTANNFYATISAQPVEKQTLKQDVTSLTRTAVAFGQTIEAQRKLARRAQEISTQAQAIRSRAPGRPSVGRQASSALAGSGLIAVHVTKKGDTLESLSRRYYNRNPDHSIDIARANLLPWMQVDLDPGITLIIPSLKGNSAQGV